MHTGFAPAAYHELDRLDSNPTDLTQPNPTNHVKVHVAHDREHAYHDSLHSTEFAQLYPQVGGFIASKVTKSLHFAQRTLPLVWGQEITT
jgi:hypothetical protein